MQTNHSTLTPIEPYNIIFFDCDGTLSLIEGIDFLAELNGVGSTVKRMTEQCMGSEGISASLYEQRLTLVQPNQQQLAKLKVKYVQRLAPLAKETVTLLHRLGKTIHILSAGIRETILPLAEYLQITEAHVHAVHLSMNPDGHYATFDHRSPLINNDGKKNLINRIAGPKNRCVLIGDGANDLAAANAVTRFVGYGGMHHHPQIMQKAEIFLLNSSFSALLPLLLTQAEHDALSTSDRSLYENGVLQLKQNGLLIHGEQHVYHSLSG